MLDTIKEYLVSLGFAVDQNSYNEATKVMDNAGESVAKFAGSAVKKFAIAGAAVEGFVAATTIGIAKFLGGLAQADLANEKLARQMWTSKDAAASYNNTLKAMGVTLQDLYLSPELMRNFQRLREQANEMRAPDEYAQQMKQIRSIQFEFTRMKLEATYSLQWIGYYFVKYMEGPIQNIKKTLSGVNDNVTKEMPSWTKNIAQVMSWFARLGVTSVRALKDLIQAFEEAGSDIPKNVLLIGGALTGLATIIATGPIGMISALLVGILLLLDDYYTYMDGGDAQFGAFWEKVNGLKPMFDNVGKSLDDLKLKASDFFKQFKDSDAFAKFKEGFGIAQENAEIALDGIKTHLQELYDKLEEKGVFDGLKTSVGDLITSFSDLFESEQKAINEFLKDPGMKKSMDEIGDVLDNVIIAGFETLSGIIEGIADTLELISKLIDGNFRAAAAQIQQQVGANVRASWLGKIPGFDGNNAFVDKMAGWGQGIVDYLSPSSTTTTQNSNNKITLNQTNNIQSSDPSSIVGSVTVRTMDTLRNFMGVIR